MRKLAAFILVLGLALTSLAADYTRNTSVDTIAAGDQTLSWTNISARPMELVSLAFSLPAAATNQFSVDHLRDYDVITLSSVVETNVFGTVETNTPYVSARDLVTITNRILGPITLTNATSNVYDTRDDANGNRLPSEYFVGQGDRLIYTWSYTNEVRRVISNMK